jgi:HD-GYP domain-containing protein (c-di-GMP phosphodiesterase class II)
MSNIELERVSEGDIVIGEPLPRNSYDQNGKLLLRKGYIVESESQLTTIIERGLYQNIHEIPDEGDDQCITETPPVLDLLETVCDNLEFAFNEIRGGDVKSFLVMTINLCKVLEQACNEDMDTAIGHIFMDKEHAYTVRHPIHVAIICQLMAKQLKMPDKERMPLLAAALTANIAMIDLQEELYHQTSPLTDDQRRQISEHPERGAEILRKAGVTNDMWIKGVLHHHEAMDGSGYPHGLGNYSIPPISRIIAVADIYCAAISKRAYKTSLSSVEVMREIFLSADKRIESKIANMCVKMIGIYPPGTYVRLSNKEIGVVRHRGTKAHLPVVQCIAEEDGARYASPVLRDCSDEGLEILEIVLAEGLGFEVTLREVW